MPAKKLPNFKYFAAKKFQYKNATKEKKSYSKELFIDNSVLLKESINLGDDNLAREICLIDEKMISNMACIHARKMAKVREAGQKSPELDEARQEIQKMKEDLARKDLNYYSALIDISMNSIHKNYYRKTIDDYLECFMKHLNHLDPTDYALKTLGLNSYKIIVQLAHLKQYTLMHKFWINTMAFFQPENEHLYSYLCFCIESGNKDIVEQAKEYVENLGTSVIIKNSKF